MINKIKTVLFLSILSVVILFLGWSTLYTASFQNLTISFRGPKYAYATILTGYDGPDSDKYFTAVMLLAYQLLHDPLTSSKTGLPFVILITEDVPGDKREKMNQIGAKVIQVDSPDRDWIKPKWERWNGVMAKLKLWTLTDYEKVAFLDADTVLFHSLDDIFMDSVSMIEETKSTTEDANSIPEHYLLAGIHDWYVESFLKPPPGKEFYEPKNYINAGFMTLAPSLDMYEYLLSLLDQPDKFDTSYPEQNLINYAYRTDGPMPWKGLNSSWNSITALGQKYPVDVLSLHHKWWQPLDDEEKERSIQGVLQRMQDRTV
jgi:alpha-N-acetylglucosamine transferase